jgi:hypothetical protein
MTRSRKPLTRLAAGKRPIEVGLVSPRAVTGPKRRPNHAVYLRVLRGMSPEARLRKAFELSAFARALFRTGLRRRFPHLSEPELEGLVRDRLERCHNRNY